MLKRSNFVILLALLLSDGASTASAQSNDPKEATNRFANMTAQERRNALMAAKGWAKAIAGDDRTRYYIELQSALLHIKSGLPVSSGTSAEESQPNKMIMAVKSPEGITLYGPSVSGKEVADAVLANLAPEEREKRQHAAARFSETIANGSGGIADRGYLDAYKDSLKMVASLAGKEGESNSKYTMGFWVPYTMGFWGPWGGGQGMIPGDSFEKGSKIGNAKFELGALSQERLPAMAEPYFHWNQYALSIPRKTEAGFGSLSASEFQSASIRESITRGMSRDQVSVLIRPSFLEEPTWNSLLASDPRWQQNYDRWENLPDPPFQPLRILGGAPTGKDEFSDCVAVYNGTEGSGVLIGPNVVLTAGHVIRPDLYEADREFRHKVWVGWRLESAGHPVDVKAAIRHPKCIVDEKNQIYENDIGILILDQQVGSFKGFEFASGKEIDSSPALMITGYGLTSKGVYGFRQKGELVIGSTDPQRYGCHDYELVAGLMGVDACHGDSGGGCFVEYVAADHTLRYKLAAVISRAYRNGPKCGAGGIQVRVDKELVEEGLRKGGWALTALRQYGGQIPGITDGG